MKVYLRLLTYAKPYAFYIIASFICMLILSGTTSAIAYLVKPAIDDVFLKQDFRMLVAIPIILIIVFFVKGLSDFGQSYLMGYAGNSTVTDIREAVYRHIQSLSLSFFTRTSTGTLMSRIANDVDILRRAVSDSVKKVLRNFFLVIGLTGVAFYQNWKMSLFCFLLLPWVLIPIVRFGTKSKRYSRRSQERMGRISTFLDETISGNQTVKAFCMENYANERFLKEIDRLFRINIKNLKVSALSSPIMEIFGGLLGAVIIYYGGYSVIQGSMTTGEFASFIAAVGWLYRPIKALGRENLKVQSGLAAAVRVFEVLDLIPEIQDKPNAIQLPALRESIEFKNVSFRYEDQWVLKNLNLKAKAGEIVAIVGHSGAGKTTIANLLLRFYDVSSGVIFIDGIDIKAVTIKSLRQQIAFVTQQTILFNDTVRNNICYGSYTVTDEKIIQAAKAAYAHEFIKDMPEGYETFIGEKGVKLSGGQCQRIAIARALVKDVPILILDEATSSLDTHSEKEVQQALENLMQGRTTFLIAHRLSTVRNAHQIIVLSDGGIIERGTHDDLLQQRGVYGKLIEIQSGYHKRISTYDHIY